MDFAESPWVNEKIYELHPLPLNFILQYMYFQGVVDTVGRTSYDLMDNRIIQRAEEMNKNIIALDLNQAQDLQKEFSLNKVLTDKLLIKSNLYYMEQLLTKNAHTPLGDFLQAYKAQTLDYKFKKKPAYTHILDGRNALWLLSLESSFMKNSCFVAVGIKHLYYKNGLIMSLRKAGFDVKEVML